MNIIEAAKSGKKFKRAGMTEWLGMPWGSSIVRKIEANFGDGLKSISTNPYWPKAEDLYAEDWEISETAGFFD